MPSNASGVGGEPLARLEVRLLGVVEIILDGRRLRAFNSLRLQRFLALLALRRDLQHRSRLAFDDGEKAVAFERYLKTGSGYAFARRHFW